MLWPFFLSFHDYNRLMRYIFLFFFLSILSACGSQSITVDKAGAPALWKVSLDEQSEDSEAQNSLYLFGTVHVLPKGAKWSTPALEKAIDSSDILVVETLGLEDTANISKIFLEMAQDEPSPAIVSRLSGDDKIALEQLIDQQNLSKKILSSMETWAATLAIANSLTDEMGLERSLGVETIVSKRFKDKDIQGLETIASQFAVFDNLPEAQQRNMLKSVVNDAGNSEEAFLRLLNAWLDGDIENLLSDSGMMALPQVRKGLLDDRNEKWAIELNKKMQQADAKQYFIAVGAAHLVGEKGVPNLLKGQGYKVERIQ